MFYSQTGTAFRILNVFHILRGKRDKQVFGRHFTGLSYRIRGSTVFGVGDQKLSAGTGSVTYIPKGVDYRNQNGGGEELICVHLDSYGTEPPSLEVEAGMEELEPLFQELLLIWESGEEASYNRSMVQLYRIFEAIRSKKEKEFPKVPSVIAPGVELMQKNFRNPTLTVAEMAKASFVSEVYFRKIYRLHFGESPLQTVLNLRFRYVTTLLDSGYYTVKQTAELSGFGDVKYFRTAFKKRFGKTVSDYLAKK